MKKEDAKQGTEWPATLTLGVFLELSLQERAARLLEWAHDEINQVLNTLEGQGMSIPLGMIERLSWAVAFNMDRLLLIDEDTEDNAKSHNKWSPGTPWRVIWDRIHLDSLALSVLCEKRSEWQNPSARPVDLHAADQALNHVFQINNHKVLGHVKGHHYSFRENAEDIVQETWFRVMRTYWSVESKTRFPALRQIPKMICGAADRVAVDFDRKRKREPLQQLTSLFNDTDDSETEISIEDFGISADPTSDLETAQLRQGQNEAIGLLPPKRKLIATMVLVREIPPSKVALSLGISKAAVSKEMSKAKAFIAKYLEEKGYT